jgi:hypothetical protein
VKDTDTLEVVLKTLLRKAGLASASAEAGSGTGSDEQHGRSQL